MYLAKTLKSKQDLLETIRQHEIKIKNLYVNEDIKNNVIKTLFEIIKIQDNRITKIESLLKK
jgi:hypothetical protein